MRVAVVGGSGRFGSVLAWRLARQGLHVIVGSRDARRAVDAAGVLGALVTSGAPLEGARNRDAVRAAEVVILAVPAAGHDRVLRDIAPAAAGRVVVDTCVCHDARNGGLWVRPAEGSAAARVRRRLPRSAAVAATLHTVSARHLRRPEKHPPGDVLVAADGHSALEGAAAVVDALGLRWWEAGDLEAAASLEQMACLLSRLADRHQARAPALRFHGLRETAGRPGSQISHRT